ncbi:hypothetical protein PtA15_18A217 [Puccinia triticina]|uniref:Uncharacterized protein n=1 Tax=Puccinia triticina TaxID=208348 RepID=A0ABY7D8Q6_9BASI|nr:uncharacterized protein PtA15_18A217 [Puccinia triticina]WAQ93159.1 hypothetical protein PtA15_18A217 [Puccinia triticina]
MQLWVEPPGTLPSYPKLAAKNPNVPPAIVVQSLDAQSAEAGLIFLEPTVDESGQDPKTRAHAYYKRLHPSDANPKESFSRLLKDSSLARVSQHLDDLHEAFQELKVGRANCRSLWDMLICCETSVKRFYPKLAVENHNVPPVTVVQSLDAQSAEAGLVFLKPAVNESGQDPETRAHAYYKRLHPYDANPEEFFSRLLEDSSSARVSQHLGNLHEAFQELEVKTTSPI